MLHVLRTTLISVHGPSPNAQSRHMDWELERRFGTIRPRPEHGLDYYAVYNQLGFIVTKQHSSRNTQH